MAQNKFVVFLSLIVFLAAGCGNKSTESKTLTEFSKSKDQSFSGLYFYPTTIRMLAKLFGNESGSGFSEVKGAKVFFSLEDDDPEMIKTLFTTLQAEVVEEGYEVLVQMKSPESNIHVYMQDGEIPGYIFFIRGDAGDLIAEVNGNLSQESIREIMTMDLSEAAKMFDLIPETTDQPTDSLRTSNSLPVDNS